MRVAYNVDFKGLWTYLYEPTEIAQVAPIKFCVDTNADDVIRIVKKGTDILINTYSNEYKIKNLITAKQGSFANGLSDGDYLFDLERMKIIFDMDTGRPHELWSMFPPKVTEFKTLFCLDNKQELHKMFAGAGAATMAFCVYWINKKFLRPKEMTDYGIKLAFVLLEHMYALQHYDIEARKEMEKVRLALNPSKIEPEIPYESKIYQYLKHPAEENKKPKKLKPEQLMLLGELITVSKSDTVLLSQIVESGIIPHSDEIIFVTLDRRVEHLINASLDKGTLTLYVDKEVYMDQVLLDLGLEDRLDIETVAKDAQF